MQPFWLLLSIVIQEYESIKISLKKMYMGKERKKEKERPIVEIYHHLWIQ